MSLKIDYFFGTFRKLITEKIICIIANEEKLHFLKAFERTFMIMKSNLKKKIFF